MVAVMGSTKYNYHYTHNLDIIHFSLLNSHLLVTFVFLYVKKYSHATMVIVICRSSLANPYTSPYWIIIGRFLQDPGPSLVDIH